MKSSKLLGTLTVLLLTSSVQAQTILKEELEGHKESFKRYWNTSLELRFDKLPKKGSVGENRIPYAGAIYPDTGGGTYNVCRKYDRAFHRGRGLASGHEAWDARAHRVTSYEQRGWFGRRSVAVSNVPYWSGHCNGWAAASIRHAEPAKNVTRNGVVFSPSDIKGLLAELYTFSDTVMLGGQYEHVINPASFHLALGNWIGLKNHPLAMEATPGSEIWNFPIYSYNTTSADRGQYMEVKVNIAYKNYVDREHNSAPRNAKIKYLHYYLNLNSDGEILGGGYYGDSSRIDFLWVPLPPTQGGQKGNERGNPYLNVNQILALWRDSVDEEQVAQWTNLTNPPPTVEPPAAAPAESTAASEQPGETTEDLAQTVDNE